MPLKIGNGLDLQSRPIVNVADPGAAQEAATKNYVDGVVRGLDWKQEVVAASTGNVDRAAPGTTLDGVTLAVNDRILLKDQTAAVENGIYVWTGGGVALTRSLDADTGAELSGSTVTVQRGTVNADRVYRVTTDDPITLGTTAITLVQVGAGGGTTYLAGNGLIETPAGTFNVGAGAGIAVTADAVAVDTAVVARKFSTAIGNGTATSIAVTHNLGTRDVQVTVRDSGTFDQVLVDNVATDANTVTMTFAIAPTTGQFRVTVIG